MTPLLFNAPTNRAMWLTWSATHQSDHFQIIQGIWAKKGLLVPILPIDPVPLDNPQMMLAWFMAHQAIHSAMNAAMGVGGSDLSFADFRDQQRMAVWMEYNAIEHAQIAQAIAVFRPPQPAAGAASQAILPQPTTAIQSQPQGGVGVLAQPQIAVQPQPVTGTQVMPQGGIPQAPLQPFPTLQPQPSPAPVPGLNPGTPVPPGG